MSFAKKLQESGGLKPKGLFLGRATTTPSVSVSGVTPQMTTPSGDSSPATSTQQSLRAILNGLETKPSGSEGTGSEGSFLGDCEVELRSDSAPEAITAAKPNPTMPPHHEPTPPSRTSPELKAPLETTPVSSEASGGFIDPCASTPEELKGVSPEPCVPLQTSNDQADQEELVLSGEISIEALTLSPSANHPESSKEINPESSKEINPEGSKEIIPESSKEINPESSKEINPESAKEINPESFKEINHSWDQGSSLSSHAVPIASPSPEIGSSKSPASPSPEIGSSKSPASPTPQQGLLGEENEANGEKAVNEEVNKEKEADEEEVCERSEVKGEEKAENKELNKGSNKEMNEESNEELNLESNRESNRESNKKSNRESNKKPNKKSNKKPNKTESSNPIPISIENAASTPQQLISKSPEGTNGTSQEQLKEAPLDPARVLVTSSLSTKPKTFDFTRFLETLRTKRAEPITKYIRSFLISFSKKLWTTTEQVKIINDFKRFMVVKFDEFEPFCSMSAAELENSHEGLEKLIMNKLYGQCFSPKIDPKRLDASHKEDIEKDEAVRLKLQEYAWVELEHLDIHFATTATSSFIEMAIGELQKINNYRAPRDKIIVLLNCCKIIFGFLKQTATLGSADAFIPVLIYIILKSNIPNFVSNINYIERFRDTQHLAGENAYYLSSLQGAVGFIANLSREGLTVSDEEFDLHYAQFLQAEEEAAVQAARAARKQALAVEAPLPVRLLDTLSDSPTAALLTAQQWGSSLSNFLSPPTSAAPTPQGSRVDDWDGADAEDVQERRAMEASVAHQKETFTSTYKMLRSMFPDLDVAIVKELVVARQGNIGDCIDVCLELTSGN